jgi:Tfp pilus assembly protein PilW
MTLVEVLTAMGIIAMVILGSVSLLLTGLQAFARTSTDVSITDDNANGLRRISESLRGAMAVTVASDGTSISYQLPARSSSADPVTGEAELREPLVWDGVTRSYSVNRIAGTLTDSVSGRVFVRKIVAFDPQPGSTQYGMSYAPFSVTTIGSARAVTINLITQDRVGTSTRYLRLKTTAVIRNYR